MYKEIKLSDEIFFIGVNDRRTALFENMWPLPRGVSYNSYLIKDERIAIIDTIEAGKNLNWEIVGEPVEQKYSLDADKYQQCIDLGKAMAERLKDFRK